MLIDPSEFLQVTREPLAEGDPDRLAGEVHQRWSEEQICTLLQSTDVDARRVAALVIGLIGEVQHSGCLARGLHDSDPKVSEMAEHGLWSIWFRRCPPQACETFHEALEALEHEQFDRAVALFDEVIAQDPDFAEAYNQKAIALFLDGHYDESIAMCREALERCPSHFGAMAGMGHGFAHLQQWDKALRCYRKALSINPTMSAIASAIERLESCLAAASTPDPPRREH